MFTPCRYHIFLKENLSCQWRYTATVLISLSSVEGWTTEVELPAGDFLWSRVPLWEGIWCPGWRWSELVPRLAGLSGVGEAAKSCSSHSWGWPPHFPPGWKTPGFIYLYFWRLHMLSTKTRINMKYTSFVYTKWPAGSMFFHLFLILISKPNISKFSTIERCSDVCLLYTEQAADTRHSVTAYVCVFWTLFRQMSKIAQCCVNSKAFKKARWGPTTHWQCTMCSQFSQLRLLFPVFMSKGRAYSSVAALIIWFSQIQNSV